MSRLERITPLTLPSYTDLFDFPIPHCSREGCGEQMVKMPDGSWACKTHSLVTVGLMPNFKTGAIERIRVPVGDALPSRRMRRAHR